MELPRDASENLPLEPLNMRRNHLRLSPLMNDPLTPLLAMYDPLSPCSRGRFLPYSKIPVTLSDGLKGPWEGKGLGAISSATSRPAKVR